MRGGDGNFESVLAGVAGTGDATGDVGDVGAGDGQELELGKIADIAGEDLGGGGALQGEQGEIVKVFDAAGWGQCVLQIGEVGGLCGGVDDEVEAVGFAGDHQVVADAGVVIGEEGVAGAVDGEIMQVGGDEGFDGGDGVGAGDAKLAHVGDIEEAGGGAGVAVFGDDAVEVLDRHGVTGEGDDFRTEAAVQRIEGRDAQVVG